jgi:hypothetical protein
VIIFPRFWSWCIYRSPWYHPPRTIRYCMILGKKCQTLVINPVDFPAPS